MNKFLFLLATLLPVAANAQSSTLSGTVMNQHGEPISNAHVRIWRWEFIEEAYSIVDFYADTNDKGQYSLLIDEDGKIDGDKCLYFAEVSADGYATYQLREEEPPLLILDVKEDVTRDFILYNTVEYQKGRRSTIILPASPNPSWGKYYKLARIDNTGIVFEREPCPKANTPYVLFPEKDFQLNVSDYNLDMTPGSVTVTSPGEERNSEVFFYGLYQNCNFFDRKEIDNYAILDESNDCYEYKCYYMNGIRVGAFHAYLKLRLCEPNFFFSDDTYGIVTVTGEQKSEDGIYYDLSGRKLSSKPSKGFFLRSKKTRGQVHVTP